MRLLRTCALIILSGLTAIAQVEPLNAMQAAERVIIPKAHFRETTLREAVEFIGLVSRKQANDAKRLNVIVAIPPKPRPSISLQRDGATMFAILKECAEQAGCEVQGEPHALVIREKGAPPLPAIVLGAGPGGKAIRRKLDQIIIPKADFRNSTVREGIEFLVQKMKQLDPDGAGVSVVMKLDDQGQPDAKGAEAAANAPGIRGLPPSSPKPAPPAPASVPIPPPVPAPAVPGIPGLPGGDAEAPQGPRRISMRVSNMPILELFRYVAGLGDLQVTIEEFAVVITNPAKK